MAIEWLRLHHDLPNDPKFRVIAQKSEQPISLVISVYIHMLVRASLNEPRGTIHGWSDEDIACALDSTPNAIERIRTQANGKLLDGMKLIGWERRQPKREDGSAERARHWRETKKQAPNANEHDRTQTNTDKIRLDIKKEDTNVSSKERSPNGKRGSRLPADWGPSDEDREFCRKRGWSEPEIDAEIASFVDYWIDRPGAAGLKLSWSPTWRNHVRKNFSGRGNGKAVNGKARHSNSPIMAAAAHAIERETGRRMDSDNAGENQPENMANFDFDLDAEPSGDPTKPERGDVH